MVYVKFTIVFSEDEKAEMNKRKIKQEDVRNAIIYAQSWNGVVKDFIEDN